MKKKIKDILKKFSEKSDFEVFVSEKKEFGHYSSNIAFVLAKKKKKSPQEIGKVLKQEILAGKNKDFFEKIEIHKSGFLNFWLKKDVYIEQLITRNKKQETNGKRQTILLEFISANPTGPLTIGQARGAFLGDSLSRILKSLGYKVFSEYYVNDVKVSAQIKELGKTAVGEGVVYLNDFLCFKIKNQRAKIKETIKKLKGKNRSDIYGEIGHLLAKEIQKENKKFIEKELKIRFDKWFSEESLYREGKIIQLLNGLKKKKLTYEKDRALWFKTKKYGDDRDRVLVRETGEPTYFLSDLAYHLDKFKKRKFDKIINIWGADHYGYQSRLLAALKALAIPEKKISIIITQILRLKRGKKQVKVSKRQGQYLTLKELIGEIGLDAARFFFLLYSPDTHMDFDLDLAKKKSLDNPLYYLQYCLVRCESIIKKAKSVVHKRRGVLELLNTEEDLILIRKINEFQDKLEEAGSKLLPQVLVNYSLDLAKVFHNFYEKEKVISSDRELSLARLFLVFAVRSTLYNLFDVLGLEKIKKM